MKKIMLTPYAGYVLLARSEAEFKRLYQRELKEPCAHAVGRGVTVRTALKSGYAFIVYAKDTPALAHEFGHVLLDLWKYIGAAPQEGNGEPFCYMMSHLMEQAAKR